MKLDNQLTLNGKVFSGRGLATKLLDEATPLIYDYFGNPPVPGSLNVVLFQPIYLNPDHCVFSLQEKRFFWPIEFNGIISLAYRWRLCPLHILEIVAPVMLRKHCDLHDRHMVSISLDRSLILPLNFQQKISWMILWKLREHLYYTSESYSKVSKRMKILNHFAIQGNA